MRTVAPLADSGVVAPTPPEVVVPTRWPALLLMTALLIGINVGFYFVPIDYTQLAGYAIPGVFALTALATATIVVPVPYIPVILRIAEQTSDVPTLILIAVAAGAGSVIGEISGYMVGRAGRHAFEDTRLSRWVATQMTHPVRAFIVLFALSAPPNPLFDVAGIAAGTFGVPFWLFAIAVFLGRMLRMLGLVFLGAYLVA